MPPNKLIGLKSFTQSASALLGIRAMKDAPIFLESFPLLKFPQEVQNIHFGSIPKIAGKKTIGNPSGPGALSPPRLKIADSNSSSSNSLSSQEQST